VSGRRRGGQAAPSPQDTHSRGAGGGGLHGPRVVVLLLPLLLLQEVPWDVTGGGSAEQDGPKMYLCARACVCDPKHIKGRLPCVYTMSF
jgi:hypothetical protein